MNPSADTRPVHTIDARNRVVAVNAAWLEFMRSLVSSDLTPEAVIGRPVWDFVRGVQVRQLWEILFERVRAVGAPVFVPMRADTATLRRVMDVELHPLPEGAIRQVFECVWTESRAAIALLDASYPRNDVSLQCCAWCNRIQVRMGAWEEIEDAVLTLRIEATESLPEVKQAVCSGCKQSLLKTFPARVM
ncbi:MAG TPA: PAS domain-containing protein [Povalibacter sp.]|jgi:hypothetical protein